MCSIRFCLILGLQSVPRAKNWRDYHKKRSKTFYDLIKKRRSVREFSLKSIDDSIIKNAIKSGVNVLFLSGNSISAEIEPIDESKKNIFKSFCRGNIFNDDADILGSKSLGPGYGDWTVTNSNHWIYKNTLLKNGDKINGLINRGCLR